MRISDWSSDVCSSDLCARRLVPSWLQILDLPPPIRPRSIRCCASRPRRRGASGSKIPTQLQLSISPTRSTPFRCVCRSEEHTSELQSLMRISYAVFCLKKKTYTQQTEKHTV